MGLKDKLYQRGLRKILDSQKINPDKGAGINPSKNILILFEGTENSDRQIILDFAARLKASGKNIKLLSYIDSKGELMDFGMAVYNYSSINWLGFPKKHIMGLLDSQKFDVLLNLNISDKEHLHALACKAKADFKVSLPTKYQHDFTLIFNTKEKKKLKNVLDQMMNCLEKLTF